MAGFASGLLIGGLVGAAGLVALSLALPLRQAAPVGVTSAAAPVVLDHRGQGLVVPDPAAARVRPEAGLQTDRPALIAPTAAPRPAETRIAPVPGATPDATPDQALAVVPAGSEFSRATREGAPQLPAPLAPPDLGDAPAEPPPFAAPIPEPAPGEALAQPGTRPEAAPTDPAALAAPAATGDQPVAPAADSPVPVPPPGEVVAPQLAPPVAEAAGPTIRLPDGPPPAILKAP